MWLECSSVVIKISSSLPAGAVWCCLSRSLMIDYLILVSLLCNSDICHGLVVSVRLHSHANLALHMISQPIIYQPLNLTNVTLYVTLVIDSLIKNFLIFLVCSFILEYTVESEILSLK